MARVQEIRGMAEWYATDIASSPADWMKYLDTAARLYRYSFTDQLLIYAQRPQATACASLELWNKKMMRWVNRGAKGIALLDETGTKAKIRYVFDVKDTHMVQGGRSPYLWQLQEHQRGEVLAHLSDVYNLEEKDTADLADALMSVAKRWSMKIWRIIWMAYRMQQKEPIWKTWMKGRFGTISGSLQRTVYIICLQEDADLILCCFLKKRISCTSPIITGFPY